jgi:hypothetical protein
MVDMTAKKTMIKTLAITFNDEPNVIHLGSFNQAGASVVELKLQVMHPRTKLPTWVFYRRTSVRGKNIYFYSEGNRAGEALGG